jgi:O-antigen/teichoic acid export membrane protein
MSLAGNDGFSPFHTARGTIFVSIRAIVASSATALFFIFVARVFPSLSELGLLQGIQSIIVLAVILSGSELARSATRFISYYEGGGKSNTAHKIYPAVIAIGIALSGLVSIVMYVLAGKVSELLFHSSAYVYLVQLTSFDIFLFSLLTYSTSLLYAMQKFRRASTILIVNTIIKFGLASLLFMFTEEIGGIVIAFIISDGISFFWFLRELVPRFRRNSIWAVKEMKPMIRYSIPLFGSSILVYLSRETDIYLLLTLTNLTIVGIYSPAVFTAYILLLIQTSLDQSLVPLFSRIFGRSGINELTRLATSISRFIFLLYLPISFALLAGVPFLLPVILGERYSESVYPTMIIVSALIFIVMTPVFNNILLSSGYTRIFLYTSGLGLALQLIVASVAIPLIDASGAAISKALSYIIGFVIPTYYLKKMFGNLPYDRSMLRNTICGSAILATIILLFNSVWQSMAAIVISYAIGIISYLLILRLTKSVTIKDIDIIDRIFSGNAKWLTNAFAKVVVR